MSNVLKIVFYEKIVEIYVFVSLECSTASSFCNMLRYLFFGISLKKYVTRCEQNNQNSCSNSVKIFFHAHKNVKIAVQFETCFFITIIVKDVFHCMRGFAPIFQI